jgi:outer membrane protein TolC
MRNLKKSLLVFCIWIFSSGVIAQELLIYDTYIQWVREFHPVSKQADIRLDFGQQELRAARGGFDPRVFADLDRKRFKELEYYDTRSAGVVVPTMAGVELKGVVEQNRGVFLNPENEVPTNGLYAVGASLNLGQGLFIDQRRATLRQAQIFLEATKAERQQILNDLYLDATEAYWEWAAEYQNVSVLEEGVRFAEERFNMVKESYIQGDFPAIDTVEAYTQLMDRTYRLQNAQIDYFRSTQFLNTFLWDEEEQPVNLLAGIYPENVLQETFWDYSQDALREFVNFHPELQVIDFGISSLEIDRRFRADLLKPVVKVNYNFLAESFGGVNNSPFLENNYKMGIYLSTPLFLRRERGNLGVIRARLDQRNYQRDLKVVQLQTKLESEIYNFETVQRQFQVFTNNVNGLQRLLEGEMTMFEMGESSLFLINAREVSLFGARLTLNTLAAKRRAAYAKMINAAGLGFLN